MAKTLEQLLSLSTIIANETKAGANTALRVGGLFSDIIYYLRDLDYADKDDIPSLEGYATEQWVLGKGYATTSDLDTRIDALVNGAPQAYDTLKEIADVLAGNVNSIDDILTALGTKADKATTLGGYGITDAYTIAQIDSIVNGLSVDISTLEGYFIDGVANSALRLSDNGSYTAWGQTFFTNGKPKSVSGALTDITDITSSGTITTNKIVIGNGTIEWDEANKGFKVTGLYSTTYLSAKGANTNGGGSSGVGLITSLYRYADLGKTFSDTNNDTFNAYTINKINTDLGSRISVLEGKATNVSFTQSLTSGTQIGSISIDGVAKNIYAPTIPTDDINKGVTAYGWGNHANVGYAMASALSGYQTKITSSNKLDYSLISGVPTSLKNPNALTINNSAGTAQVSYDGSAVKSLTLTKAIVGLGNVENTALSTWVGTNKITTLGTITTGVWNGTKIANGYLANSAITIAGTSVSLGGSITAATLQSNLGLGSFAYKSSLAFTDLTNKPTTLSGFGITDAYTKSQVDSALGDYLPLSGGTLSSGAVALNIVRTGAYSNTPCISYIDNTTILGSIGIETGKGAFYWDNNTTHYLIHSGNIGSQSVLSAQKLITSGGLDAVFVNSSGNVGIGTTNPRYQLETSGDILVEGGTHITYSSIGFNRNTKVGGRYNKSFNGWQFHVDTTDSSFNIYTEGANSGMKATWLTNGNMGLGTTSPQYKLDVRGVIYSNTGIFSDGYVSAKGQNTSSDMRLKNVLNEVVLNVKDIANAPSMRFSWKNGGGNDVGSSAQYWQGLLPDAVKERDGMLEMQYANIALLSAIAIAKNVETHEERIARLERENEELRNEIKCLRYGA